MERNNTLNHWADILILVLYFLTVLAIGIWSMTRSKRGNVKDYFLANRSMSWLAVGASLYSSNIGTEHFVGLAGAGASTGISFVIYEFLPVLTILVGGWFFIPVYLSAGVYTFPEYMEKRFGSRKLKNYISIITLFLAIVGRLSVSIFAGSLFIQMALGWNMYLSVIILLFVTGSYTILGGLTAVMYTDTFQTLVMMIGGIVLAGISFKEVGGLNALYEKYPHAIPSIRDNTTSCALPHKDAFHLFQDPITGSPPWPGIVVQATIGQAIFYWAADQVMIQRVMAAKNLQNAKVGSLMTGFLKMVPIYMMVFPGMISRVLFPDEVGCADPDECMRICDNPSGCSNIAYPKLVLELLPVGLRGFLMAVILSAIMSSLTSIFNSASTLFTMDLYRQLRQNASQRELLLTGKLFIILICAVSIAWLPFTKAGQGGQLFAFITMILSCFMPSLSTVALFAIFWKKTTELGALCCLVLGHVIGFVRLVLEMVYPVPACGEPDLRPAVLSKIHFLYFGNIQLLISYIVIVVISLLTKPRTEHQLSRLTWWTMVNPESATDVFAAEDNASIAMDEKEYDDFSPETESDKEIEEGDLDSNDPGSITARKSSVLHLIGNFLFGKIDTSPEKAEIDLEYIKEFLREDPKGAVVINGFALILIAVIFFMLGVYH